MQTCLISRPQQVLSSIGGSARPSSCFCRGLVHCCNSPTGRAVVGSCLQDCTVLGGFERVPFNALPLQSLQLLASCWFGLSAISRADMTPGALLCCLQKLQQQYVNPFVGCLQAFLGTAVMARFMGPVTPLHHCGRQTQAAMNHTCELTCRSALVLLGCSGPTTTCCFSTSSPRLGSWLRTACSFVWQTVQPPHTSEVLILRMSRSFFYQPGGHLASELIRRHI